MSRRRRPWQTQKWAALTREIPQTPAPKALLDPMHWDPSIKDPWFQSHFIGLHLIYYNYLLYILLKSKFYMMSIVCRTVCDTLERLSCH